MKISADVLRLHPLLSLLPRGTLKRLAAGAAISEFPKGTVIFHAGDRCDAIYLIISGRCEAVSERPGGGRLVEEVLGPGDVIGDRAFLNDEPHRTTVSVVTHCVLLRIPAEELEGIFKRNPEIAGQFTQTITRSRRLMRERQAGRSTRVRRVVSLLALAPRVDERKVVKSLAASLRGITRQDVLLLEVTSDRERSAARNWSQHEPAMHGPFRFTRDVHRGDDEEYDTLRLPMADEVQTLEAIAPLISHCGRFYDYVLLHLAPELPERITKEFMVQADLAYVLLQPSTQCLYDFELLTRALGEMSTAVAGNVKPIVFVEPPFDVVEFHEGFRRLGHAVHSFAHGFPLVTEPGWPDRRFALHINRLAREIARCRVGLALSSGGAKGLAHVGVIQVLEENGIEIDAVSGASMGAYVGSLWAYGLDGPALEKIARELEGRWGLLSILELVLPPRRGFLSTRRVARRLSRHLGTAHFSDLIRPLRVVATHLETLERVVFSSGEVVRAVEASIAMPGICVPIMIDGEPYVDGGIAEPVPIQVLEEMGIERIIAANVVPTPQQLRYWLNRQREQNGRDHASRSVVSHVLRHLNYFAPGNVFDTMAQAINSVQMRVADAAVARADVVLRPVAMDAVWHDFTHPRKYIALGRSAAEAQLKEIQALVHRAPDANPPLLKSLAVPAALQAA